MRKQKETVGPLTWQSKQSSRCPSNKQTVTPRDLRLSLPANWLVIDKPNGSLIYVKNVFSRQPPGIKLGVILCVVSFWGIVVEGAVIIIWGDTWHMGSKILVSKQRAKLNCTPIKAHYWSEEVNHWHAPSFKGHQYLLKELFILWHLCDVFMTSRRSFLFWSNNSLYWIHNSLKCLEVWSTTASKT